MGPAQLFDVNTGVCLKTFNENFRSTDNGQKRAENIIFSNNGLGIALILVGRTIELWDAINLTQYSNLSGHRSRVLAASFTPNSELLASASYYDNVRLWDVVTGASKGSFDLNGQARDIVWSQDSRVCGTA